MLITIFLVILASTTSTLVNAKEITFHCLHGHEIKLMGENGCDADSDCDTDETCDDNECMHVNPIVTVSEEPPQVTDLVHINGTSTTEESTPTETGITPTSTCSYPEPTQVVRNDDPLQFTPNQALLWDRMTGVGIDHSPNASATWPTWDETVMNPNTDGATIKANACEGGLVKGMFDAFPIPFEDPLKPTKTEVDAYNIAIILQVFPQL
jgi:hypothetical protein